MTRGGRIVESVVSKLDTYQSCTTLRVSEQRPCDVVMFWSQDLDSPAYSFGNSAAAAPLREGLRGFLGAMTYAYGSCGSGSLGLRPMRLRPPQALFDPIQECMKTLSVQMRMLHWLSNLRGSVTSVTPAPAYLHQMCYTESALGSRLQGLPLIEILSRIPVLCTSSVYLTAKIQKNRHEITLP